MLRYSTEFNGAEYPLFEGGAWQNNGLDWTHVQKVNGVAYGTQTGLVGYDDSYAYLTLTAMGWPPNVALSGVVYMPQPVFVGTHEVELLLRWSDAPHVARGYEVMLNGSQVQIIRWNGPIGDFTPIGTTGVYPGLKDGDLFSATAIGPVISGYVNGVKVAEAVDSTYPGGHPGIGFFRRALGANSDFGFKSFIAADA